MTKDYSNQNLRGRNFRGQDLRGANFANARIQGANFRGADLTGANFAGARAGLQKRWVLVLTIAAPLVSAICGFLYWIPAAIVLLIFDIDSVQNRAAGWMGIIFLIVFYTIVLRKGLFSGGTAAAATGTAAIIAIAAVTTAVAAAIAAAVGAVAIAVAATAAIVVVVAAATITIAVAAIVLVAAIATIAAAVAIAAVAAIAAAVVATGIAFAGVAVVAAIAAAIRETGDFTRSTSAAVACTILSLILVNFYMTWRAFEGDERHAWMLRFAAVFASIGGTTFRDADLTDADFTGAVLKNAHFQGATLIRTCWKNAQKLRLARIYGSVLARHAIRELLVTGNGYGKDYSRANLAGANLQGANLENANLRDANLNEAKLQEANLKNANLSGAASLGTDFRRAYLTGACLEGWNIDAATQLDGIDCQWVYLLEHPDPRTGSRDRRPHDPDKTFEPGDFEKLYRQIVDTVQILLRNGINPEAFREAFKVLIQQHGVTPDDIRSIEKKGNDVLVTFDVPKDADKAAIARSFDARYAEVTAQLEAARDRLAEERQQREALERELVRVRRECQQLEFALATQASDRDRLERELAIKKQHVEELERRLADFYEYRADMRMALAMAQSMSDASSVRQDVSIRIANTNENQTFTNTGSMTGNVVNLGEIGEGVRNEIETLPSSSDPANPGIRELLEALRQAIADEENWCDRDKAEALEQLQILAVASRHFPPQANDKKKARSALRWLQGLVWEVPATERFAEKLGEAIAAIQKWLDL